MSSCPLVGAFCLCLLSHCRCRVLFFTASVSVVSVSGRRGKERDALLNDRRKREKAKAKGELASFFIGPSREEKERVVEKGGRIEFREVDAD